MSNDVHESAAGTNSVDERFVRERFPKSAAYHPDWISKNGCGGNAVWLAEWLCESLDLRPGMRVLDLGCGKVTSSVFLAREFGVDVWATDLWFTASENSRRLHDVGFADRVFPIHADARSLPFAAEFFDLIVAIDSSSYFGTDDLYLNYLANFVRPGGQIGIAGAGLVREVEAVPEHLREMWSQDFWCLHSAAWWRRHWERTGIVDVEAADMMPDGWRIWLDWQRTAWPDNKSEIDGVAADEGRTLGYCRAVGRRRPGVKLEAYCWPDTLRSMPEEYEKLPLLRS
jgi:cyclopropane fatty-acyl-phospholipid synthase-like methyltransferase